MRHLTLFLALALSAPMAMAEPPARDRMEARADREAAVLAWIEANDAEKAERLQMMRERDPERYTMALKRAARLMKASEDDPGLLERRERLSEIHRELMGLSALESDDKKVLKAREEQVQELVEEGFDLKMEAAEARITSMEAKLEEARDKLEQTKEDRDAKIAEQVDKVLSGEAPERGERRR